MSATPTSALLGILQHYSPASVLCVSRSQIPAIAAWREQHADCQISSVSEVPLSDELRNQRYDLAIVADQLEHLDKRTATELLAGLRNLSASRIAVLVDTERATEWQENDFFALALQRRARFSQDGQSLTLYSYDLAEYKSVPDWLNSKYWANPEMFDKYWW
jgi:DNA-binding transcriptional LysR family regulator